MAGGAPRRGRAPPGGRASRIARYLRVRFGAGEAAAAVLLSLAAQAGGALLASPGPLRGSRLTVAGTLTGLLLTLYLRVADDLKDWGTDRQLAEAGDERFRGRPQVTGEVGGADLGALKLSVAALVGLLLATQPPACAVLGGISFVAAWLSSRWFFFPGMARSLPIAFVTHNPLAILFLAYAVIVGAGGSAGALPPAPAAALLGGLYLPVAAWEIGRKVRMLEEETAYQTWSSVLGWRAAAALPALLCGTSASLLAFATRAALGGWTFGAVAGAAAALPIEAAARLLLRPSPAATRRLRPAVERYVAAVALGLLAFAVATRGVRPG